MRCVFYMRAGPRIVVCREVAGIAVFWFSYAVGEQLAECHEASSRMSLTGGRARCEAERTGVWFGI